MKPALTAVESFSAFERTIKSVVETLARQQREMAEQALEAALLKKKEEFRRSVPAIMTWMGIRPVFVLTPFRERIRRHLLDYKKGGREGWI